MPAKGDDHYESMTVCHTSGQYDEKYILMYRVMKYCLIKISKAMNKIMLPEVNIIKATVLNFVPAHILNRTIAKNIFKITVLKKLPKCKKHFKKHAARVGIKIAYLWHVFCLHALCSFHPKKFYSIDPWLSGKRGLICMLMGSNTRRNSKVEINLLSCLEMNPNLTPNPTQQNNPYEGFDPFQHSILFDFRHKDFRHNDFRHKDDAPFKPTTLPGVSAWKKLSNRDMKVNRAKCAGGM